MASMSSTVVEGPVSVYCSVRPNRSRTSRDDSTEAENPSYALIVNDTAQGTVSGVIPLADRPDVDYVWALLQQWGLTKARRADGGRVQGWSSGPATMFPYRTSPTPWVCDFRSSRR
jgi:hypothetical protein